MKKKLSLIMLMVLLVAAQVMAADASGNGFSLGANAGTNTGVGAKMQLGKFDVMANLGWKDFAVDPIRVGGDVQVSYNIMTLNEGQNMEFPVTLGLGLAADCAVEDQSVEDWNLTAQVPVGVVCDFQNSPMSFYARIAPGVRFYSDEDFQMDFAFDAYAGVLWAF